MILRAVAIVLVLAFALPASACGNHRREPTVVEIVVPAGTSDRINVGEKVDVMPARIDLRVGDTIRIRNDDAFPQDVGPYHVGAGERLELTYHAAGRFEGECPLSAGNRYEIVVTD